MSAAQYRIVSPAGDERENGSGDVAVADGALVTAVPHDADWADRIAAALGAHGDPGGTTPRAPRAESS